MLFTELLQRLKKVDRHFFQTGCLNIKSIPFTLSFCENYNNSTYIYIHQNISICFLYKFIKMQMTFKDFDTLTNNNDVQFFNAQNI